MNDQYNFQDEDGMDIQPLTDDRRRQSTREDRVSLDLALPNDQRRISDSLPGFNAYSNDGLNTKSLIDSTAEISDFNGTLDNRSAISGLNGAKQVIVKTSDKPFKTFNENSFKCKCFNCGIIIDTKVVRKSEAKVYILCFVMAIVGCFLGCCLIPFCIKKLKRYKHFCPQCD